MRILEIETFGRGGLTHYAYNLTRALADRGHRVTLISTADYELEDTADLPANIEIRKPIARVTRTVGRSLPSLVLNLALKAEAVVDAVVVAALARRLRPDVVHLHCTNPVAVVYLALLRVVGQPVVYTAHIVTPHEPIRFQTGIYRRIHQMSDLIVAHSGFDRKRLLEEFRLAPARVTVIPHGEYGFFQRGRDLPDRATSRRRLGVEPDAEVALFFGYLREYKGLDLLLEGWPTVAAARPRARLVVAGDPVQLGAARRAALETWADRVGAVHRLEYIPFHAVEQYFSAADVLVMPYRRISQSGVLFLGLSLGIPVVATSVGGLPEMLDDGESAVLIPPGSSSALAEALIRVLDDPGLRQRLSAGGRRVADRHSWPSIAEQTERAFSRVVRRC